MNLTVNFLFIKNLLHYIGEYRNTGTNIVIYNKIYGERENENDK